MRRTFERRISLGTLLLVMVAYILGLLTVPFLEGFDQTRVNWECFDEDSGNVLLGPIRAWQRRSRALAEVKDNVWLNTMNPDIAATANQLTYAPYLGVLSLASAGVTGWVSGMGAKDFAGMMARMTLQGVCDRAEGVHHPLPYPGVQAPPNTIVIRD